MRETSKKYLQEDFLVDFLFFSTCRSSKTALPSSIPKVPKYPKMLFPGQNFRQGCPSVDFRTSDFLFKSLLHLLTILLLYCFMLWFFGCKASGISAPWPGIEPEIEPLHLLHWKAKSVPLDCRGSPWFYFLYPFPPHGPNTVFLPFSFYPYLNTGT